MVKINGIKKRWVYNNLGFTVGIFSLIVIIAAFVMRSYFYSGIQQNIKNRANSLCRMLKSYSSYDKDDFINVAKMYIENFHDENSMELLIFNDNGDVVISSCGFLPNDSEIHPDYQVAKYSENNIGFWEGKSDESGECLMSCAQCIYDNLGNYVGAVKYVVSLEKANSKILTGIIILLVISVLIIVFMIISGMYFIKSIVYPIDEICNKAKIISQGNFHIKLDKKYDDEIGDLCDTINYMAKELDATEKLKNEFISSVSHELRTPLTAIKGWAETIQLCGDTDSETRERGLNTIVKETERLSWIVEGLLDFSSIKEKRIKLIKEKIDILAEIDEAVYMFKDRAKNEKKVLTYNEPKTMPPVFGDKNRLRQVFINILDNALKYTSEGDGISVDVAKKNENISISITDNGCGIPLEHLPNVTKKFYKANYLKRGSGIGLAIVDEIVTLHGGSLTIMSEEGFGTTVTVLLPVMSEVDTNNNDI